MKKKLLAVLLVMSMAAGILAGCGNSEPAEAEKTQEVSKTESSSEAETSKPAAEPAEAETEAEPAEVETVKWVIYGDMQEDEELVMAEVNKLLEERYHLNLEILAIPMGEYDQKVSLMSTSGEDFDLCFTCDWLFNFQNNAAKEAFYPLNDLLGTEAADLLNSVFPEWSWDYATIAGQRMAIPNNKTFGKTHCMIVQKDLAEKYGLDWTQPVDSITDLEWFMQEIVDNEEGIYPVCYKIGTLWDAMTEYNNIEGIEIGIVHRDDPDLQVEFNCESQLSYDSNNKFREWYEKGYIRSDIATVQDYSGDMKSGKYAMYVTAYNPGVEALKKDQMGEEVVAVRLNAAPYISMRGSTETMTAINVNSQNPEAAIKMLGVMWTDVEIYNMVLYGLEGVHYNWVDDNHIKMVEDSKYYRGYDPALLGNQFNAYLQEGQADNTHEFGIEANATAKKSPLSGFVFNKQPVETEIAQIAAVKAELEQAYMYVEDYDAWLAEYKEKLEKAGARTVLDEIQKQIDAFVADRK